jgi:SAM-dependent methyltransferase
MNNQREELFCLRYELNALANLYCFNRAERWVKGFLNKIDEKEHIDRYAYALKYVNGKSVLDIACGCGFGSFMLATEGMAKDVVGVDLDAEAIRYGNYRYGKSNIHRIVADAEQFTSQSQFDVIVSFETIEHLPTPNLFIENLHWNLASDGVLIVSTPISKVSTERPRNPYHQKEWSFLDFPKLFNNKFTVKQVYLQNAIIINRPPAGSVNIVQRLRSFARRFINRVSRTKPARPDVFKGMEYELLDGQYEGDQIIGGYQILVLEKRDPMRG